MPATAAVSTPVNPSLTLKRRLNASPEKVYAAWTEPTHLTQWFGPEGGVVERADLNVQPGGRYTIVFHTQDGEQHQVSGVYKEVVPNEKLAFTWAWRSTPERESHVTVMIKSDGTGLDADPDPREVLRRRRARPPQLRLDRRARQDGEDVRVKGRWPEGATVMQPNRIVSRDEWIEARKALLAKEKAMTRQRDRISAERRDLPWVKVEKDYAFDTPDGRQSLADLFDGRSQLIVKHFMLAPGQKEGCVGCSFEVDHVEGALVHLEHHDVTWVSIARAPLDEIEAYKRRMGWRFKWVSSFGSDFNYDFDVSFTKDEVAKGEAFYNYEKTAVTIEDLSGIQRVHQGRQRRYLPHLFGFRTRRRGGSRHLHAARPDAKGAQ